MAEFGETKIGNISPQEPENTSTQASEQEKFNLGNEALRDKKHQINLDTTRVELFSCSIKWAIGILVSIVIALLLSVLVYLRLLVCPIPNNPIPSNFWHIPLLLAFMASTILSVILTLTAKFGDKRNENDNEGLLKNALENTSIKEVKNFFTSKS